MNSLHHNGSRLRIELGRQDLYSNRNPTDNFWSGIRLPVGYVRVVTKGKLLGGTLSLSLWDAEVVGTLMTSAGNISLRIFTHATQPLTLFESNCSGNEEAAVVFVATTRCVNRWDVAGLGEAPCANEYSVFWPYDIQATTCSLQFRVECDQTHQLSALQLLKRPTPRRFARKQ